MVIKRKRKTEWKPDFSKPNPYEGMPPEYVEEVEEAFIPKPGQPYSPVEKAIQQGKISQDLLPTAIEPLPETLTPLVSPEIEEKEFVTPQQFKILRQFLAEGTLGQKILTRDLWLSPQQAQELGYVSVPGQDFRLSPTETGNVPEPITSILMGLSMEEQDQKVLDLIQNVEPEIENIAGLSTLLDTDWDNFISGIQIGGETKEKRQLLTILGMSPDEIENAFHPQAVDLFQKALPLLVTDRNADQMTDYYFNNPQALRRSLITAGRNTNTEALVKSLYPEVTEKGVVDYFNPRVPGTVEGVPATRLGTLPTRTWLDRVREVLKDPASVVPYLSSSVEMVALGKLMKTALALEQGKEVSQKDLLALKEYVERATMDTTWGYEVADTLAQLLPFAGEFVATIPVFGQVKATATKASLQALKTIATRTGLKVLKGKMAQFAAKEVIPTLVAGTARTVPAGITRIPASTMEKQLEATLTGEEESVFESAAKAFGEQWVEVVSESTGGLFTALAAPVKGQLIKLGLFKAFQKANPGKRVNDLRRLMEKMGYHGVLGEMLEERVADVGHGILEPLGLSDQKFSIPSAKQLSVELAAFSVPGAAVMALQTAPALFEKLSPSVKKAISEAIEQARIAPERGAIGGQFISGEKWEAMSVPERTELAKVAGLEGKLGSKTWADLTLAEKQALAKQVIPEKVTPAPEVTKFAPEYVEALNAIKGTISGDFIINKTTGAGLANWRVIDKATGADIGGGSSRSVAQDVVNRIIRNKAKLVEQEMPKAEAAQTWTEARIQPSMLPEEVAAIEVRPPAKGKITQVSMDDQLKLEQAKKAAEEAPAETEEAYQAQWQVEGLKAVHQVDPVAQWRTSETVTRRTKQPDGSYKLTQHTRQIGFDSFIPIGGKEFPETFTVKQARMIWPTGDYTRWTQQGTREYNKVPRDVVLDPIASELGFTGTTAVNDLVARINQIRKEKRQLQAAQDTIKGEMTQRPLPAVPELTTEEVTEQWQMIGQPRYNLKQIDALVAPFAEYIMNPNTVTAYEFMRASLAMQRSERFNNLKAKLAEIKVQTGAVTEEQARQVITDTLSGEYAKSMTDYLQFITGELRDAHFAKVAHVLKDYPAEYAGTITALVNALSGRPIPNIRPTPPPGGFKSVLWPQGASALDKLQFVFGKGTRHMKALEKIATEKKPLEDVVEGVFHETGRPPIPIDEASAEYLRNLPTKPSGQARLGEEYIPTSVSGRKTAEQVAQETMALRIELAKPPIPPIPPTYFEKPIDDAFNQGQLWPRPVRDNIVRALKEVGMLPVDIGNFLRANKASIDFSFWRQQAPLIASHPISFTQANVEVWRALWSQKSTEASWERITRDPLYQMYEEAAAQGGDFLRPVMLPKGTAQYKGTEEYGYTKGVERWLPKLTAALPWVKLSARAFETGTNVHNWLIFKSYYSNMLRLAEMYASGQKKLKVGEAFDIEKEMVDFSKSLANFSARGSLGKFAATAPELSALFFAPRAAVGRILSVRDLINANPRVRLEAWKNAASFVGTFGGIVLLGAAMGWWEVEKDPRNAEYMSIRIGNTRIDPWGGYRQFLVFFARAITLTGVSSVTGAEYEVDPINLIQTFIRGKASPLASLVLDFWRGKNFIGEEVDVANKAQWAERVAPFAVWDIYEAFKDDPVHGLQIVIPAVLGAGVQTYTGDWKENFKKLGLPKYSENLAYGMFAPPYDTADFWSDTVSQFKGVDPVALTKEKGFPEYIRAIVEAKRIQEHLETLPSERLVSLNADPEKGVTFGELRNLWGQRQALVDAGDDAEFKDKELQPDGTYKEVTYKGDEAVTAFDKHEFTFRGVITKGSQANNGNFSQRQFALLNEYWSITDKKKQAAFLEEHKTEIGVKPRDKHLRTHPTENALLAIFGQAKILTREAFPQFKTYAQELDFPDNALPKLTLPPEGSLETHWTYEEMVSAGTYGSWEAQLLLKQDAIKAKETGVQSYTGWRTKEGEPLKLSYTPIASLEIKATPEYHGIWNKLNKEDDPDYVGNLDDKIKEKDGLTAKDRAIAELKATKIGDMTWIDLDRKVTAIEKGTEDNPIPDELVTGYVEHYQIVDQTSGNSAEAKLNRYDNPDLNDFMMNEDYWDKPAEPLDEDKFYLDNYLVPRWRIEVDEDYKTKDAEYEAIKNPNEAEQARLRAEWLAKPENLDYRRKKSRKEAYELNNTVTGVRLPIDQVEFYVTFSEIPEKGKRRERFVVENPKFAQAMFAINGKDIYKTRPKDVPNVAFDDIYDEWVDTYDLIDRFKDNNSPDYKDNTEKDENGLTERDRAKNALRFTTAKQTYSGVSIKNKVLTGFGLAEITREAYGDFVPDEYIDTYVGWRKMQSEGKPPDWDDRTKQTNWFEDDWFLRENQDFYQNVYLNPKYNNGVQRERKDYRKVPSRLVFEKYLIYVKLPHNTAKKQYRATNLDLDEWGQIALDWTSIAEQKRREELTPQEKAREELYERQKSWEEQLEEIEEILERLK